MKFTYVWDNDQTLESFLDGVISDPSVPHVYDGGPEWEIGNRWNFNWHEFCEKLTQVEEIIKLNPDVKSRLILLRGCHSDVTDSAGTELRFVARYDQDTEYRISELFGQKDFMWNYLFWFKFRSCYLDSRFTVTDHLNTIPTKLFCCLQHRPHAHRISAMLALINTGLNHRGLCTFANSTESWERFCQCVTSDSDSLRHASQKLLRHAPEFLSHNTQTTGNEITDRKFAPDIQDGLDIIVPDYQDYLFDIVVESTTQAVFFTEKTLKPIFWGKPFVILGSQSQNTILRDLGYETFPEYFDLSSDSDLSFDNTQQYDPAITKHYERIIKPLNGISQSDLAEIKHKVRPKIHHNHSVLIRHMFDDDLIPYYVPIKNAYKYQRITDQYITQARSWLSNDEYFKQFVPGDYRC